MPNQRAPGKKLMGAMASAELWSGVDAWLAAHPNSTVSDFLLSAILEKLKREHIAVDEITALRDERARVPFSNSVEGRVNYLRKTPAPKKRT